MELNEIITLQNPQHRKEMEALSPEGLVGQVLRIEAEADEFSARAKALNASAKELRSLLVEKLKHVGLTSATHESGYRATIRITENIAIENPEVAMKSLKKNKLAIFITKVAKQIIPAHEEINEDQLKNWIKTGTPAQKSLIDGVKVETKETLVIAKK
jgi:hypothetical protein